tara:strand:+ start:443 stop:649 length:207 start_codon:yes stop_codon:yes gene_type:complete
LKIKVDNMKYIIKEAGSMIGALVKGESTTMPQIVVEYKCDAKGEWIRFIKDPPDEWRLLKNFNILSRK